VTEASIAGAEQPMLAFETLTLAPIERTLIAPTLLTAKELQWLNSYHARVLEVVGPQLAEDERQWLEAKVAPIG
jgi:Xaa-Pro aminopeptidase